MVFLMKVYRYTKTGYSEKDNRPLYERKLFDAITFNEGGCSSPLGPSDEFEVYVEEVK